MRSMLQGLGLGILGLAGWSVFQTLQPPVHHPGLAPEQASRADGTGTAEWRGDGAAIARATGDPAEGLLSPRTTILPLGGTPAGRNLQISGLPGYGRMTFLLPVGNRVTEAEAVLPFASEIPDNINAVLRVSVNGQRRHDVLLGPGREDRDLVLPLLPRDLARNTIQLSFALSGVSTTGLCGAHIGNALVTLRPEAHLRVLTARPLASAEDRYRAAGAVAGFAWPALAGADDRQTAGMLSLVVRALRAGIDVDLRPAGNEGGTGFLASDADLTAMLAEPGSWRDRTLTRDWPLEIVGESGAAALRNFTGAHSWRYGFSLTDLPDERLPGMLDYGLKLGPVTAPRPAGSPAAEPGAGQGWLVSVTLNGRLLEAFTAPEGSLRRKLPLPAGLIAHNNQLEISVGRSFGVDGVCNDGPPLIAELAADSVLLPGTDLTSGVPARLSRLAGTAPVLAPAGLAGLTPPEAAAAADLLANLPLAEESGGTATVSVVRLADLPELAAPAGSLAPRDGWIYLRDDQGLHLVSLGDRAGLHDIADQAVGLLIRPHTPAPAGDAP